VSHVPQQNRWMSTQHLMGYGYWIWIIPLADGATSIGIVVDTKIHPFRNLNRRERALKWLWQHEPQCAQIVEDRCHLMLDFKALRDFSYSCERVFSSERWCLTGDAGTFLDPLYSPGSDFIAISNSLITDVIVRELDGENIYKRVEYHNQTYLNLFNTFLSIYTHQYPIMGNSQVMLSKVMWDIGLYWAFVALLFFYEKYWDVDFIVSILEQLKRFRELTIVVQVFFRRWAALEKQEWQGAFVDVLKVEFLYRLNQDLDLTNRMNDEELRAKVLANITLFEDILIEMFRKAAADHPELLDEDSPELSEIRSMASQRVVPSAVKNDLEKVWLDSVVAMKANPSIKQ
jgi:hypothetical protein